MDDDLAELTNLHDEFVTGFYERVEYQRRNQGELEQHVEARWHVGLLKQLEQAVWMPRAVGGEPGGGGKPKSRPPCDVEALTLLDDATERIGQAGQALVVPESCDIALHVRRLRKMRRSVRLFLGYEARMMVINDTVCGSCGGALTVARDASTSVRCIGTEDAPPCGNEYSRYTWISLLDGQG
jgi:hypothetical protein